MIIVVGFTHSDRKRDYIPSDDGWRRGARHTQVALRLETALERTPQAWAEALFTVTNVPAVGDDPAEQAVAAAIAARPTTPEGWRSVTVGDTVWAGGRWLACESVGFTDLGGVDWRVDDCTRRTEEGERWPEPGDAVRLAAPWPWAGSLVDVGDVGVIEGGLGERPEHAGICFRHGTFRGHGYVSSSGGPATIATELARLRPTGEDVLMDVWEWNERGPGMGNGRYYQVLVPLWDWHPGSDE